MQNKRIEIRNITHVKLVVNHFQKQSAWNILPTTVHEGHKDYKCEFCGKSASCLKNQMHTIHEGHKDYKCESCGKLFSDLQLFCNLLMFVFLWITCNELFRCGSTFIHFKKKKWHQLPMYKNFYHEISFCVGSFLLLRQINSYSWL